MRFNHSSLKEESTPIFSQIVRHKDTAGMTFSLNRARTLGNQVLQRAHRFWYLFAWISVNKYRINFSAKFFWLHTTHKYTRMYPGSICNKFNQIYVLQFHKKLSLIQKTNNVTLLLHLLCSCSFLTKYV